MPWSLDDPPTVAKNWSKDEIQKCVEAANATLQETGDEQKAIFACIAAAGRASAKEDGNMDDGMKREDYPWDECIQDQLDEGYDQETAEKICGSIKAKYGSMVKPTGAEMRDLLKELDLKRAAAVPQYTRAYPVTRAAPDLPDDAPVRFVASTEGVKRDGLDLKAEDWDLSNFLRYPVVLWAHDYESRLPIGTGSPSFEGSKLLIDVTFDRDDEFAMQVRRKALKGLVAGSVGWNDLKDGRRDLMEFSICPVPADPLALPVRSRAAMQSLAREIDRVCGVTPGPIADTVSVQSSLANAPTNVRYGAIMSARDMEQLEQAIEILQKLLARAKHEDEESKAKDDKKAKEAEEQERSAQLAAILTQLRKLGGN